MSALWMLAASAAFAAMGACVKLGAGQASIAEMLLYRSLLAMAVMCVLLARQGHSVRTNRIGMHAHRGASGFIAMFTYFYAVTALPLATAVSLAYTAPVFLTLLLAWIARKRPSVRVSATVVVGFIGVVVLLQPSLEVWQIGDALIALGSGAVSAVVFYNIRLLVQANEPEARVVFYFSLFSALGALVWMIPQPWHWPGTDAGWYIAGVAVFGTAGQLFMTYAYGRTRPLLAAALSYSTVAFSSILGILLWDEILPLPSWLGMALIIGSGIMAVRTTAEDHGRPVNPARMQ